MRCANACETLYAWHLHARPELPPAEFEIPPTLSIMSFSLDLARKRRIWNSAFVLTSLCAQIATAVMASGSASTRGPSAQWNKNETAALLTYLEEHKSEIGDGGMFKMGTFNAAASEIAKYHTSGPVKTGDKCKTKWRSVDILFIYILCASLIAD